MTKYQKGDLWIIELSGEKSIAEVTGSDKLLGAYMQTTVGFIAYPDCPARNPDFRAIRKLDIGALLDRTEQRGATVEEIAEALWIARGGDREFWRENCGSYRDEKVRDSGSSHMASAWRDAGAVAAMLKTAGATATLPSVPAELRELLAHLVDVCEVVDKAQSKSISENWSHFSSTFPTGDKQGEALGAFADIAMSIGSDGARFAALLRGMLEQEPRLTGGAMAFLRREIQRGGYGLIVVDTFSNKIRGNEVLRNGADCIVDIADGGFRVIKRRETDETPSAIPVGEVALSTGGVAKSDEPESGEWQDIVKVKPYFGQIVEVRDSVSDIGAYLARCLSDGWYKYPSNERTWPVQWRAIRTEAQLKPDVVSDLKKMHEAASRSGIFPKEGTAESLSKMVDGIRDATDEEIAARLREVRAKVFPDGDPTKPGGGEPKTFLEDFGEALSRDPQPMDAMEAARLRLQRQVIGAQASLIAHQDDMLRRMRGKAF